MGRDLDDGALTFMRDVLDRLLDHDPRGRLKTVRRLA